MAPERHDNADSDEPTDERPAVRFHADPIDSNERAMLAGPNERTEWISAERHAFVNIQEMA